MTGASVSKSERNALRSAALKDTLGSMVKPPSSLADGLAMPRFMILYFLINLLSDGVFMGSVYSPLRVNIDNNSVDTEAIITDLFSRLHEKFERF